MEAGDTFTWAFSVFQWNCMTRSINIDEHTFSQLSPGKYSCIVKHYNTNMDQAGEKNSPKICYSNPFNLFVCIITALGHKKHGFLQKTHFFAQKNHNLA